MAMRILHRVRSGPRMAFQGVPALEGSWGNLVGMTQAGESSRWVGPRGQGTGGEFQRVGPPICPWTWQVAMGNLIWSSFVRGMEGTGQHFNGLYSKKKLKKQRERCVEKMDNGKTTWGKKESPWDGDGMKQRCFRMGRFWACSMAAVNLARKRLKIQEREASDW